MPNRESSDGVVQDAGLKKEGLYVPGLRNTLHMLKTEVTFYVPVTPILVVA